ncbi:TetR/AcrR family transcriptional regulator [Nocardiopsis composta]|uniref:AcrR family transcriptional regulator n=1 Tax=Nocardiopsis composta TaxID=157465 RepID=A0A7W8QRV0_9ACTN|nr:TetR/AcrR family transcriptional regulator [Nocardiopsis composta]MBB5435364.1 AcrR family transcriptional regulator [Nocardiopsis composta]
MAKRAPVEEETRTRARTRRAILEAAVSVLGERSTAPLSEVAQAAGVARSTLQRYFPERSDLLAALDDHADELLREATERARIAEGSGVEAFVRLAAEYFPLRDAIMLAWGSGDDPGEPDWLDDQSEYDRALYALIERGHADGTIDRRIAPVWAQQLLWAHLYSAWTYTRTAPASRHEALTACLYSLVKVVCVGDPAKAAAGLVPLPAEH